MLEQITREAHRVPICLTTPLSPLIHAPSSPPPECRLIQASSLIHVFIYYFIGCVWAGERRHLVVRTVINSLKPLRLSSSLLSNSSLTPIFVREDPVLPAQHIAALPILCCPPAFFAPPSLSFFSYFSFHLASTNSLHWISLSLFLCFSPAY